MSGDKLTPKQRAFVDYYILNVLTGKQPEYKAAEYAGYKGNVNQLSSITNQNLQKVAIKSAIKAAQNQLAIRNEVTEDEVIEIARLMIASGMVRDEETGAMRVFDCPSVDKGLTQLCKIAGLYAPERKELLIHTHEWYQEQLKRLDSGEITEAELITDGQID